MSRKIFVTGIRYAESEKIFLNTLRLGFQRVFNIGMQSLILSLHAPHDTPCIYLSKTGEPPAPPGTGTDTPPLPCRACCPACPIRISMPKKDRAAHDNMQEPNGPGRST